MRKPKAVSDEGMRLLLGELGHPYDNKYSLLASMAANTGFRIGDLLQTRYSDVGDTLTLHESKTGKTRTVPIIEPIKEAVKHQQATNHHPATGYVFFNSNLPNACSPVSRVQAYRVISGAGKRTGQRISPHSFRKTYAIRTYGNCGDLAKTQQALGHSCLGTTALYVFT